MVPISIRGNPWTSSIPVKSVSLDQTNIGGESPSNCPNPHLVVVRPYPTAMPAAVSLEGLPRAVHGLAKVPQGSPY